VGTYHLGDLVGYAPWPNEVPAVLVAQGVQGVAGNYDSTVATRYNHCGCSYEDPKDIELAHLSFSWTLDHVSDETREYLGALPFRLDLRPWGGHLTAPTIILIHGNPLLNTVYWTEDRPDSFCLQMAEKLGCRPGDTVVFGHTHKPWTRTVDGIQFVNAGSVGRPKDGDWRACCLLLHLEEGAEREKGRVRSEFLRVEYDLARAQRAIRDSDLPDEFAQVLETGGGSGPS
ncbi:MAG: metallophosphoesterase, partial [Gemmatimonadetes bacterium]|nr:metallophosphoesterase family protein [Gemmatimonadota bacterium]NNM05785.1 metallophosphoesterase [Gemmatimonadota bacterium]